MQGAEPGRDHPRTWRQLPEYQPRRRQGVSDRAGAAVVLRAGGAEQPQAGEGALCLAGLPAHRQCDLVQEVPHRGVEYRARHLNGPIKVHDLVPPGTTASFEELGAWTCNAATKVCETNGSVVMKPNEIGDGRIFNVHVSGNDSVAHALNCRLNNTARIIAPVGPPWNILPADDQSHAAYDLPAELCHRPANLKLTKMSAQVGCNTTGGNQWRCVYNVLVRNMGPGQHSGPITVQDWVPAHPAGVTMTFEAPWNCVDGGTNYDCTHPPVNLAPGQQVVLTVTVFVTPGQYAKCELQNMARIKSPLGAPKNTDASDDLDLATADFAPMVVNGKPYCYTPVPTQCPPSFAWTGDHCGRGPEVVPPPQVCPPGSTGQWPRCREVEPECPRGMVGKYPDCRKPPVIVDPPRCPPGTVGRYPNCTPRPCPRGLIGTYPDCRKPPVIDPPKCPPRMVGRPPNCRRIDKHGSSVRPQQLRQWKAPMRTGPVRPMPSQRVR